MNKKIKICYVVAVDITIRLILLNYLKRLDKNKYDVWVVCSPSLFLKEIEKEGIKVKTIKITRKIFSPISDIFSFFHLIGFFRKEKFEIVQVQTPKVAFLGQLAAKFAGVPIIINNNFGFYFQNFSPIKKRAFIFFERIAAKCSDLMFAINREDIQTAIKEKIFSPERIKYLGFGIDINRFNPNNFSADFILKKKKELGISTDKKVVGIIARLVKEKGYIELFSAFKNVVKESPQVLLLVVGIKEPQKKDSIDIEIIKDYGIENNIIFLGERKDIEELYTVMDIFVLPSHREGLGNTILEASASEKPVVATDIRGCRESVDNRKTGILVPPQNSEELAKAILYLIKNPEICLGFGKAGRRKIESDFNEDKVFKAINEEYKRLIKEKLCRPV